MVNEDADEFNLLMSMYHEGFDYKVQKDRDAYAVAHYGRHDVKSIGILAVSFRVSMNEWTGPQHRLDDDRIEDGCYVMWYDWGIDCPWVGCSHGWIRSGKAQGVVAE